MFGEGCITLSTSEWHVLIEGMYLNVGIYLRKVFILWYLFEENAKRNSF